MTESLITLAPIESSPNPCWRCEMRATVGPDEQCRPEPFVQITDAVAYCGREIQALGHDVRLTDATKRLSSPRRAGAPRRRRARLAPVFSAYGRNWRR